MGMAPAVFLAAVARIPRLYTPARTACVCAVRAGVNAQPARAHKLRPTATRANPASASTGLQPPSAQRNPNGERTADAMYVCTPPLGEVTPINIPVQFAVALPANGTN